MVESFANLERKQGNAHYGPSKSESTGMTFFTVVIPKADTLTTEEFKAWGDYCNFNWALQSSESLLSCIYLENIAPSRVKRDDSKDYVIDCKKITLSQDPKTNILHALKQQGNRIKQKGTFIPHEVASDALAIHDNDSFDKLLLGLCRQSHIPHTFYDRLQKMPFLHDMIRTQASKYQSEKGAKPDEIFVLGASTTLLKVITKNIQLLIFLKSAYPCAEIFKIDNDFFLTFSVNCDHAKEIAAIENLIKTKYSANAESKLSEDQRQTIFTFNFKSVDVSLIETLVGILGPLQTVQVAADSKAESKDLKSTQASGDMSRTTTTTTTQSSAQEVKQDNKAEPKKSEDSKSTSQEVTSQSPDSKSNATMAQQTTSTSSATDLRTASAFFKEGEPSAENISSSDSHSTPSQTISTCGWSR